MVDPAQPPFAGAVPHAPGPAAVEAADEELLPCGGHVRAVPGPADHDERDDEEAPPRASEEFRVGHPCPLSVCGSAHLERLLQRPLRAAGVADDDGDLVAALRQLALGLDRENALRGRLQRLLEHRLLALLDGDRRAADGAGLAERALHAQLLALAADLAGPQLRVLERDLAASASSAAATRRWGRPAAATRGRRAAVLRPHDGRAGVGVVRDAVAVGVRQARVDADVVDEPAASAP